MVPGPNGKKVKGQRYGIGKRWMVRWEEEGRRRAQSFSTRDAADLHLSKITVNQESGTHIATSKTTVAEYGDEWIKKQIHQRPTTAEQMEIRWRVHIRPVLGPIALGKIQRTDVQNAILSWMEGDPATGRRKLAASSIAVTYAYFSAIMKTAVADHVMHATPCKRINLPSVDHERVIPLTVAQVQRIADAIPGRYRMIVVLGAATGMRSGELRGLTADRLVFTEAGPMRVRIDRQITTSSPLAWGPPKTSKSDRSITVPAAVADAMRQHMAAYPPHPSGLVFTGRTGGPVARTTASTIWHGATEGMELKARSGWHELRHHHASLLIAAGLSVTAVADRLGHEDPTETLQTYAHLWENDEQRALGVIDLALGPLFAPVNESRQEPYDNPARVTAGQDTF